MDRLSMETKFGLLDLDERILRAVDEMGFEEPSPIQAKTIPRVLEGRDLIGQAQTGTGKTAAFGIPILQRLGNVGASQNPRALVLTPTRELAIQVAEEISRLGRYMSVRVLPVYGGQPIGRQLKLIKRGVDVVVGTPGRILDHLRRRTLKFDELQVLVLDEADEMLDMGFIDDISAILQETPSDRQTLLFSATMPAPIVRLAERYMRGPERVSIRPEQVSAPDIEQVYYEVRPHERFDALCRIIDSEAVDRAIIFCRTKRGVDELTDQLRTRGYPANAIHGDLDQRQRDRVMQSFRSGDTELLVATDVAARGVDVDRVTHVVNYDIPQDEESYVHRIGRTGRAGRTGTAMTLIHPKENRLLRGIERSVKSRIKRRPVPTMADVAERQRGLIRERLVRVLREANLKPFRGVIEELVEEFDSVDVGAAALYLLQDGQENGEPQTARRDEFGDTGAEAGMVRFFINVGRRQGIGPADIVRSISQDVGIPGGTVGKIDIYENFAFVEVPQESAGAVARAMRNSRLGGGSISIEPARPPS